NLSPARYGPPDSLADLYYSASNPARSSLTQLSVPIYWQRDTVDPNGYALAIDLQLGLLPIPAAGDPNGPPAGLVLFPLLAGAASVTFELTQSVDLTVEGSLRAALVRLDIHPGSATFNVLPLAAEFAGSAAV